MSLIKKVNDLFEQGKTDAEIAAATGLSISVIEAGRTSWLSSKYTPQQIIQKVKEITVYFEQGKTNDQIVAATGLPVATIQKARQDWESGKYKTPEPKEDKKNVFQKVGGAVVKGVQTVGKAAENVLDSGKLAASLALMAPLKPVASSYLKQNGVTPSADLATLVSQVSAVRAGKSSFGMAVSPEMVMMVVTFLTSIFKSIKDKKASGKPLTAEEKAIADKAADIEKALKEAVKTAETTLDITEKEAADILEGKTSDSPLDGTVFGASKKTLLIVLVLIILFIFLIKKFA